MSFYAALDSFRNWDGFRLEPAKIVGSTNIFGIAEFISTLALLVVIVTLSDFRYRYRVAVQRLNVRTLGTWVAATIGALLLLTEFWFQNSLPTPRFVNSYSNLKIILAAAFLLLVFYVVVACFLRPPKFQRSNAKQFFEATVHFIHQGNADRLQVVGEELSSFMCFELAAKYRDVPFAQFSRNVGEEFIANKASAFYQEDSGFESGLFGYMKPVTTSVFGSYELVERCATQNACPLDIDYRRLDTFDEKQMEGFSRAALAYFDSYLREAKGETHSYALARLLGSFESTLGSMYKLKGALGDYWKTPEYQRLSVTVEFVRDAISNLDKHAIPPKRLRRKEPHRDDTFDAFADLIFEMIFAASHVSEPDWTCWSVQYSTVWSTLFVFNGGKAYSIVLFKLRRLIFDEIKRMDKFANFKGAGILGYCLNVLGLTLVDRHKGYGREHYPLHAVALNWTKKNYRRLVVDHPKVAERCLQGSVTYDRDNHRLVKTFAGEIRKEPDREFLKLD